MKADNLTRLNTVIKTSNNEEDTKYLICAFKDEAGDRLILCFDSGAIFIVDPYTLKEKQQVNFYEKAVYSMSAIK